jgi:hypothetical protein
MELWIQMETLLFQETEAKTFEKLSLLETYQRLIHGAQVLGTEAQLYV